jgi:hypothetical protein
MSGENRRGILKKAGAGAVFTLAAGGLFLHSSRSVAAAGLTAADVDVTTSDGELNTLTIEPDITITWSQAEAVATVEATWEAETTANSGTIGPTPYTRDVSDPTADGDVTLDFSTINLLSNNGGTLTGSNFAAETDGSSTTTDVTLSMDTTLKDSGGNQITNKTDILGPETFAVTVTNEETTTNHSVSASGTAHTSGS